MARSISRIFLFLLGVAVLMVAAHNRDPVTISLPFSSHELVMPLYLFFFASLSIGIVLAMLYYTQFLLRMKLDIRQEKQVIKAKDKEITALRSTQLLTRQQSEL